MINYSFIIPHKNTPDILRKCIDSIPHREDVQIIVVDDNSDIDKVDFKHFPGLNEPCTEVYLTKEGKGAGYARNVGLEHAVGKWIVFADADDFFNTEALKEAMVRFVDSNYEIIFFKASSQFVNTGKEAYRHIALNERIDNALKNSKDYDELLFFSIPWAKFIQKQFIEKHKIRFQEVRWSNDVLFSTKCGLNVLNFTLSELAIYCVTDRDYSLRKDTSFECALVRFKVDCESSLLMKSAGKQRVMSYWTYRTWQTLYELNRWVAIKNISLIVNAIGIIFFYYWSCYAAHNIKQIIKHR